MSDGVAHWVRVDDSSGFHSHDEFGAFMVMCEKSYIELNKRS